jgi:hypothetical protein
MNDYPLIYCNGDSYSNENYHSSLLGAVHANIVVEHMSGYVINRAISGSCNRRIIRSSIHDLIHQRKLNPNQRIIALINLTFELRAELWIDDITPRTEAESNFQTHLFARGNDWRERLLTSSAKEKSFFDKYTQGRAYYYSPYAERINLLCDCVMFQALMRELNVEFLMFQGPKAEKLESEYLVDFFKTQLSPSNFFDFENFGFVNWCHEQNFVPLDFLDQPEIGHPTAKAHRAFAEQILIPWIEKNERRY